LDREPCNESAVCHFGKNWKRMIFNRLRQFLWETISRTRAIDCGGCVGGLHCIPFLMFGLGKTEPARAASGSALCFPASEYNVSSN
jgi:hypothetical protein